MTTRNGFTLVEMLVVIAIFAVIATAIGASLAGGVRAWDAARDFNAVETDALIDLQIMQRDIMNSFRFHAIGFRGAKTRLSFPALVRPAEPDYRRNDGVAAPPGIGTVRYVYDKESKALFRKAWVYPGKRITGLKPGDKVIGSLDGVTFDYYRMGPEKGQPGSWVGGWDNETNLPARVRVRLTFVKGARPEGITRTFVIPTAEREIDEK